MTKDDDYDDEVGVEPICYIDRSRMNIYPVKGTGFLLARQLEIKEHKYSKISRSCYCFRPTECDPVPFRDTSARLPGKKTRQHIKTRALIAACGKKHLLDSIHVDQSIRKWTFERQEF